MIRAKTAISQRLIALRKELSMPVISNVFLLSRDCIIWVIFFWIISHQDSSLSAERIEEMSVRFMRSGSEKNWVWRRSIFLEKELIKSLSKNSDRDWSSELSDFSRRTADESDRVKLTVLSHLTIFHRVWDFSAIWWMNSQKLAVLTWWIVKFC